MGNYRFKMWEEFLWAMFVSTVIFFATEFVGFHPEDVTDWRRWAIVLAGGLVRALAGGISAWAISLRREDRDQ